MKCLFAGCYTAGNCLSLRYNLVQCVHSIQWPGLPPIIFSRHQVRSGALIDCTTGAPNFGRAIMLAS